MPPPYNAVKCLEFPSLDRGRTIGGGDGAAVMPPEAGAQREPPAELVGGALPALDHLRLDFALLVDGEQHVEDVQTEGPRDRRGYEMRIEELHLGLEHDVEGFRCARLMRPYEGGGCQSGTACQSRPPPQSDCAHTLPPKDLGDRSVVSRQTKRAPLPPGGSEARLRST